MAKQAVWLSGIVTYGQAVEILEKVGQIPMSYSSVWRRVERWGAYFQATEVLQMAKANGLNGAVQQDPNKSKDRMGVAMDGGMIHIREEVWKELKVRCVFDIGIGSVIDPLTKEEVEQARAVNNTYVAHLGGPQHFGEQVWTEARHRGWQYAADSLVFGDGATWIWNLASEHFYDSHQLVDWYHGSQHLATAAQLNHGEGTPQA